MAPSPLPTSPPTVFVSPVSALSKRDSCATDCLLGTSAGTCTALDASCLCANDAWGSSILTCIQAKCSTSSSLDLAYSNLLLYCNQADVTFNKPEPAFTNTIAAASVASVALTATTSAGPTLGVVPTAPNVGKPVNVSAIMASICSLLLAISFVIGFFSIKARVKRARDDQTKSKGINWGGATPMADRSQTGTTQTTGDRKQHAPMPVNPTRKGPVNQLSSSMFGGTTTMGSSMDGGGTDYADAEREAREERIDAARLKRQEAAATLRAENLTSLFSDPPYHNSNEHHALGSPDHDHFPHPAPDYKSTTSLVSSSSNEKKGHHNVQSDSEDDEGQYVTMPTLSGGGGDMMTASTMGDMGQGERVWQAESRTALGGLEGGRSRLDLNDEER